MSMVGFTADASIYETKNHYRTNGFYGSRASGVIPQRLSSRLGFDCAGRYCDCKGDSDCIDMINHKCGGWTRCVSIDGVLHCICEPRFAIG